MGAVIFSDVHADADAIAALASCIRTPEFSKTLGPVDTIINLGDVLHRGNRPREAIECITSLAREYRLVSLMGNHDHAFLNGIIVSGSDEDSTDRHEQLRGSPLLDMFRGIPMEWTEHGMLFVHGGPLDIGTQTLRLKCWQRLSHSAGDSFTGYHYTAPMAFEALATRGLTHMVCGHQHSHICCRKTAGGIVETPVEFVPVEMKSRIPMNLEMASIPLDVPALFRVGGCHGDEPEFAYTDFSTFSFLKCR
ncbi:MAG: metallophosphoesterase [Methanoregula sp.]|jgi:predicted MPP superfamily phosphohydrolase